jgi:hypothetical protein
MTSGILQIGNGRSGMDLLYFFWRGQLLRYEKNTCKGQTGTSAAHKRVGNFVFSQVSTRPALQSSVGKVRHGPANLHWGRPTGVAIGRPLDGKHSLPLLQLLFQEVDDLDRCRVNVVEHGQIV